MLGKETLRSSCFANTASTITATRKQGFSPAIHFLQGTGVNRSDGKTLWLSLESSEACEKLKQVNMFSELAQQDNN
jgi:hypothetical protein